MATSSQALLDVPISRLNARLLAFRLALYVLLVVGVLSTDVELDVAGLWVATIVVAALLPALQLEALRNRRVELAVGISLALELVLWWRFGPIVGLDILPLFSVGVAGLLLSPRAARAVIAAGVASQAVQLVARWGWGISPTDPVASLTVDVYLVAATGLVFLGIAEVLRAYQDRVANQAREELRLNELIEEKDGLLASVAHHLRTPLSGVVGLAGELRDGRDRMSREEIDELLTVVADQGQELSHTLEDVLVSARAELGRVSLRPESVSVAGSISRAWSALGGDPDAIDIEGDAASSADPGRLEHLVRNLLDNARTHGRPPVLVRIAASGERAVMELWDSGSGIPPDQVDQVFTPHRGDEETTTPASLGLGLSVARSLTHLMGGELRLVAPGSARFRLELPAAAQPSSEARNPQSRSQASSAAAGS